ncbi:MAG: response regulator transcription factor [Pseudomonadota bacterium]
MNMRTLLVEDHPPLAEAISGGLERAGFAVDVAGTVADANEAVEITHYDLAILDLGLPDGSGLDLLRDWREQGSFPTIILTARGALGDRITGLDSGADDYIVKPVEIPELVARCRAILRRPGNRKSTTLTAGNVRLDTNTREADIRDRPLDLGRREVSVLEALLRRQDRVVPRNTLLEALYDRDMEVSPNAVDAAVSRLRRALNDSNADVTLKTIRGVGWMLRTDQTDK